MGHPGIWWAALMGGEFVRGGGSDLLEESEAVVVDDGFMDSSVADVTDGDAMDLDALPGRGSTHELPAMRAGAGPAMDELVGIGHGAGECHVEVGEGGVDGGDPLGDFLWAMDRLSAGLTVFGGAGEDLGGKIGISGIPEFNKHLPEAVTFLGHRHLQWVVIVGGGAVGRAWVRRVGLMG